ncbi:hypothetical protein [Streptomyces decoyicus]|uniref:hypothetical protein n=1 Tax=Streptomyces decoyicus TaxID=249567 RepID=UPI003867C323
MPEIDKSVPAGLRIFERMAGTITDALEALKRSTGDVPPSAICRQLAATMNYASQLTAEVHDCFDAAYRPDARERMMTSAVAGAAAQAHHAAASLGEALLYATDLHLGIHDHQPAGRREALIDSANEALRRNLHEAAYTIEQTAWNHHLQADSLATPTTEPMATKPVEPAERHPAHR